MRKLYIVKEAKQFEELIKTGKLIKSKNYVIYHKKNNLPYDRFGISVGKKIGNAVVRNKYKRRLRTIIDIHRKTFQNGEDYIIILRENAKNKEYNDLEEDFNKIIMKTSR